MKRSTMALLVAVVLATAALAWWRYWPHEKWAPAFGGSNLSVQLADNAHYQQNDPRWAANRLGNLNSETLAQAGCTISSVAMAMSNLGYPFDPGQLNAALAAEHSFTQQGWLMWDGISRATKGAIRTEIHEAPSLDRLDACLARGAYPIVKFRIMNVIPHWVVVVGKRDGTYFMRDPLIDEAAPSPLTRRTQKILSVRCIGLAKAARHTPQATPEPAKIDAQTPPPEPR